MASFIPILKDSSPGRQLIALTILCFASLSLVSFLSVIAAPLFGLGLMDLQVTGSQSFAPNLLAYMKFSQVISALGLFILPPFIWMQLRAEPALASLRLNKVPQWNLVFMAVVLILVQLPLINATALLNSKLSLPESLANVEKILQKMEETAAITTEAFLKMQDVGDLLLMLFVMAVLPAIGEELLFRSSLQPLLFKIFKNHHIAIGLTAFIFSFIHFQFFGFIPRFLIGVYLGYIFLYSGNTWVPVAAHFANNALAVLSTWFQNQGIISASPDNLGIGEQGVWHCIISVLLTTLGMFWFIRKARPIPLPIE